MKVDFQPAYGESGSWTPDNLLCGGFYGVPKAIKLKHGVEHLRGDILQESATAGVYELCADPAKAELVLMEDRNLTAATAAQPGVSYETGEFNRTHVRVAAGTDMAAVEKTLRKLNIYLRATVGVLERPGQ